MVLRISWNTQNVGLGADGDLEASSHEHTLEFDVVTSETHEGASTMTKHAIEGGALITDHKIHEPRSVTIEAIVSNTPLDVPPPSGYARSTAITVSTSKEEGRPAVKVFSEAFDRIQDVIATLDRLRLEGTFVTLTTARRTYDAVQILRVTEPREPEDGDSQRFQIEIQEVRIAYTRSVEAPRPREPRGDRRRDRGGQEAGTEHPRQSALDRGREELARQDAAGEDRDYLAAGEAMFGG